MAPPEHVPSALEAPPPSFTLEEAADLSLRLFGIDALLSPLPSERDQNFSVDAREGRFVLKISNPAETVAAIDLQLQALLHAAVADPALPIPSVRRTASGDAFTAVEHNGRTHLVHMLTFLDGIQIEPEALEADGLHAFGALVARMGRGLRGFFHPAASRHLLWDVKRAGELRPLVSSIEDGERAALAARVLAGFEERVSPELPRLRAQVIHGDLTLGNVVFGSGVQPAGIIDFGDMTHTALVFDLAVSLAALLRGQDDAFERAEAIIRGYGTVVPLEREEAGVLADAVAARLAGTVVISAWRVRRFPENAAYITAYDGASWPVLELFDSLGPREVRERFWRACAPVLAPPPQAAPRRAAPSPGRSISGLLERRRRVLSGALLQLSYERPLQIVRAEGVWMVDAEGRRFLDAYNNVPSVGHGHPRVVEAVARQARVLNTNTRYLHDGALELSERLTATMPAGLDTCLFVNSGSEANDLAWRLATAVTSAGGALVSAFAYHGISAALTDLSPSEWSPDASPDHVERVPPPDASAGAHRRNESDPAKSYVADAAEAIRALDARGHRVAAMVLDCAWTSDGIFTDAGGYGDEAARRVRDAGGLFVADEVQAGYGRLGSHLWSFQRSGIAPDFVTLGKPMGNGHPVAAVVTRTEIAEEFARRRAPVFSTFGGNPVSCAAALAVLDVMEEERLLERAAQVGSYLRAGIEEIAREQSLIAEVRGAGLLIGVELVADPKTRQPDGDAARRVMNDMREQGVLIGTTGRDGNVLKIRPPLQFGRAHADLLLEVLARVIAGEAAGSRRDYAVSITRRQKRASRKRP